MKMLIQLSVVVVAVVVVAVVVVGLDPGVASNNGKFWNGVVASTIYAFEMRA